MDVPVGFYVIGIIVITMLIAVIRAFVMAHILGTFKFDNSGDTYRCLMEFNDLDDVEKHKFAIVRIREADLSLPKERSRN